MININKADTQAVKALARMNALGDDALLKFIKVLVEETKEKLVYADDMDVIRRLQGRAEAYQDLLKAVDDAAKVESR